jgi:hypothetical protein
MPWGTIPAVSTESLWSQVADVEVVADLVDAVDPHLAQQMSLANT